MLGAYWIQEKPKKDIFTMYIPDGEMYHKVEYELEPPSPQWINSGDISYSKNQLRIMGASIMSDGSISLECHQGNKIYHT